MCVLLGHAPCVASVDDVVPGIGGRRRHLPLAGRHPLEAILGFALPLTYGSLIRGCQQWGILRNGCKPDAAMLRMAPSYVDVR